MSNVLHARIAVTEKVKELVEVVRAENSALVDKLNAELALARPRAEVPKTTDELAQALVRSVFAPGSKFGTKPQNFGILDVDEEQRRVVEVHIKENAPVATDPVNHGKRWTQADEHKLVRLYRWGLTLSELALLFQRYEDAIVARLHILNHGRRAGVVPENPDERWYTRTRAMLFNSDGTRAHGGNGLLVMRDGNAVCRNHYKDILECADQPVRPL